MNSLPRTIRVGPYAYKVVLTPEGGSDLGLCVSDALKLHIQRGQPHDSERETLFHELLHASLRFSGAHRALGDDLEEQVVRAMSPILLDILLRNRQVREYLFNVG